MRLKTRLKLLEKTSKQARSKENEVKISFRVLESGKGSVPFKYTHVGMAYANFLAFLNVAHLHEMDLIDSLHDVGGKDIIAHTEEIGLFQNSSGDWEMRPDIEHAFIERFLQEDHRRLGNDPQWVKSLRDRLEWLREQF